MRGALTAHRACANDDDTRPSALNRSRRPSLRYRSGSTHCGASNVAHAHRDSQSVYQTAKRLNGAPPASPARQAQRMGTQPLLSNRAPSNATVLRSPSTPHATERRPASPCAVASPTARRSPPANSACAATRHRAELAASCHSGGSAPTRCRPPARPRAALRTGHARATPSRASPSSGSAPVPARHCLRGTPHQGQGSSSKSRSPFRSSDS